MVEQMPSGSVEVNNGKLEIIDAKGCTVWFRHKMESPVLIEYGVRMIKTDGPYHNTRGLNCFWMSVDPIYPMDIFRNTTRTGQFRTYDRLRHYYVGYGRI